MATKTVKNRRTKSEVQQEFEGLAQEVAENRNATSAKDALASQLQEAEIRSLVSEISAEVIIHKIADLNTEISKSLSNLSEKLVGEVNLLNQVKSATLIETQQLEKLHKIDVAATALDQLIDDYARQKSELEIEISSQRAEWEKEKKEQEEAVTEYERDLKSSRVRELEEYKYNRDLERKRDQDKYEEEFQLREKQNREKQEVLEKTWKLREEALKNQEIYLKELQKSVDSFPARLQEETDKARQEATQQTENRLSQELLFLKKDRESEQQISDMKLESLQNLVDRQQNQITHLQKLLDEAKKEVKEIAEKAIEGASGARALSHINQIAIEQAKNRSSPN